MMIYQCVTGFTMDVLTDDLPMDEIGQCVACFNGHYPIPRG